MSILFLHSLDLDPPTSIEKIVLPQNVELTLTDEQADMNFDLSSSDVRLEFKLVQSDNTVAFQTLAPGELDFDIGD